MKVFEPSSKTTVSKASAAPIQRMGQPAKPFVDNRPQAVKQWKLQEQITNSLASKLTIQRVVDGTLTIGTKVKVIDNRRNDAGKTGTIVGTPAQHGWAGSYEIDLGDKVEMYGFNGLNKAQDGEIPDAKFQQLFDDFKTNLNKDDKLLRTLKRTASDLRIKDMPEIDQWRKNKKARIQVDLDGTSRTLQGTGYFVKGGKSYQDELTSLREEMEEDYPDEVDVSINILMQEEILRGKRYESDYPIANSIGAIANTGETARASFNQIESEMALRIPANSGVDPIDIFKNQTTYGKAIKKSVNTWEKYKKKQLAKGRKKSEVKREIAVRQSWESKTQSSIGGSQQSQYATPRQNPKLKREGSFEARINNVNKNIEATILQGRNRDRTKEPQKLFEDFMEFTFKDIGEKTSSSTTFHA